MNIRFFVTSLIVCVAACRVEPSPDWACTADACQLGGPSGPPPEPLPCAPPVPGALLLNEVLADPSGADINGDGVADPFNDEFVEILNAGGEPVDVSGVGIRVGSATRFTFAPDCLGPGEVAVVFGGGQPTPTAATWTLAAASPMRLPNQGSTVALLGAGGEVYDELHYGKEADGAHSLTRSPDGSGDWVTHPSMQGGGPVSSSAGYCMTGGHFPDCEAPSPAPVDDPLLDAPGCTPVAPGELVINEVLADPGGLDANGDGLLVWQHDEFVEVLLLAAGERDLTGVSLLVNGNKRGELPVGCHASPFGMVLFGGTPPQLTLPEAVVALALPKTLQLANAGGVVTLQREADVLDQLTYGPEGGDDQSLTRFPDGVGAFMPHALTPAGTPMSPGGCVSGESLATGCVGSASRETAP